MDEPNRVAEYLELDRIGRRFLEARDEYLAVAGTFRDMLARATSLSAAERQDYPEIVRKWDAAEERFRNSRLQLYWTLYWLGRRKVKCAGKVLARVPFSQLTGDPTRHDDLITVRDA